MNNNKSNKVKMNKFKILGVAFLAGMTASYAQTIDQAKKEIDAEKYQDAKVTLKSIVKSDPSEGKAFFLLGNVYLYQNVSDSAKMSYQSGLTAKNDAHFNNIGLGQIDLNSGNVAAAKANFSSAIKEMRRKDFEEYQYVARAYMNSTNPDYKSALATLELAKEKNAQETLTMVIKTKIKHIQIIEMHFKQIIV